MNAELESRKWLWAGMSFQLGMGYTVAFITYQLGTLLQTGALGMAFLPGFVAVLAMVSLIIYLMKKGDRSSYIDSNKELGVGFNG
jgi:ferrous iron transport protein B